MPKRSNYKPKSNYKKKKTYNKTKKMNDMKSAVSSLKQYFDTVQNLTVPNTGQIINCQNISQGFSNQARYGDTVAVTSYYIRAALTLADTTNYVRCWLILDKSSDGALPTIDEMFQTAATATIPHVWAINDRNKHRFKILRDTTLKLDSDDPIKLITFKGVFKRPLRSTYLDNSGTATAFGQNQLYFVCASDSIAVAHPAMALNTRVYFLP